MISGRISLQEFGKGVEKLGVFVPTTTKLQEIFDYYDSNKNGDIDYVEFSEAFLDNWEPPTRPARFVAEPVNVRAYSPGRSVTTTGFPTMDKLIDTLRTRLTARGARGIIGLGRAFGIMDDNGSWTLEPEEFVKAMHDYGTGFSEHESKVLFAGFDLNKNGSVDYDEFLRFVRGPLNPFRQALVDKAFAIMDRDGNGYIDYNDLKGRYDASYHPEVKAGRKTEREALGEWLETFETHHNMFTGGHNDQIVTKEEWNEYYANVSSSIDRDDYFELMMNSAWKLGEHKRTYGSGWSSTGATHVSQTLADAYGQ